MPSEILFHKYYDYDIFFCDNICFYFQAIH